MSRLERVERVARRVLDEFPPERAYHDAEHVESVVAVARDIGRERVLSDDELELLEAAAWFHDLGYATGPTDGHEARSAELVDTRLDDLFAPAERERIKTAIAATELPQRPETELGRILGDADLHTLGTSESAASREAYYEELVATERPDMTWREFLRARVEWFGAHEFHTPEGRERYQATKDENIAAIRDRLTG